MSYCPKGNHGEDERGVDPLSDVLMVLMAQRSLSKRQTQRVWTLFPVYQDGVSLSGCVLPHPCLHIPSKMSKQDGPTQMLRRWTLFGTSLSWRAQILAM